MYESNNNLLLLAINEGTIVGTASVKADSQFRLSHVGEVGISILQEYWGNGTRYSYARRNHQLGEGNGCTFFDWSWMFKFVMKEPYTFTRKWVSKSKRSCLEGQEQI